MSEQSNQDTPEQEQSPENKIEPEKENKEQSPEIKVDDKTTKKIIYCLCYLWGILFFLPLILYANDAQAKRHANEGLVLLLFAVIGNVVFGILTTFGWVFGMLAGIYSLLLLILGIVGIVYVVTDQDKDLPLIGAIKLIK